MNDWGLILTPVRHIYARFWRVSRWYLMGIAVVVALSAVGNVVAPTLFSRLIDDLGGETPPALMIAFFIGYAVLRGVTTALTYALNYMSLIAAQNLNFIAGTSFFERLLRKKIGFFIDHNPVEIQSAREKGEQAIFIIVQLALIVFLPGVIQILLSIGVLGAAINLEMVAIVIVYGAIFITLTHFANQWTRALLDKAVAAGQENAKYIGNIVNAMETLRYFGGDRWITETFSARAGEARTAWTRWAGRRIALAVLFGAALAVQLSVTFLLLLPRYYAGELTVGGVVLINMLMIQLNQPFEMIGSAIDDVAKAYAGCLPFARMWTAAEEPETEHRRTLRITEGRLSFEDVAFAYGPRTIVSHVGFTADRGRITFLTGETGAGKSTVFKLALKALEPESGRVMVDDVDLATVSRHDWYEVVGVVPQDVLLLNDTIAANIALGRQIDEERLRRATERASVTDFIGRLPDGLQTKVGERGLKLSGGERQRIAIARALYADPQFLFLDEASSALDEATETEIMTEIRRLADHMTIVAITHRRGVIAPDDQVIEIVDGTARILPRGSLAHSPREVVPP
ncbi:ABC transporter ATP-binding protein [Pseudochelatococcus lubricantis]|uniref:ABC transporter ATP-binding protein n=1 Tax=Pseudochelatococcus lubricantis TaxID=1538102 RepID=UPI0035F0191C